MCRADCWGLIVDSVSAVAAVTTALVAVCFFVTRLRARKGRAVRLAKHLKRLKDENKGGRSIVHLMARLGMSEDEVLQAALDQTDVIFRSIRKGAGDDPIARDIIFVYDPAHAKTQDTLD